MTAVEPKQRGKLARAWWASLRPVDTSKVKLPGNRSALARLRRCSSPLEALAEPETAALFQKLGAHQRDIGRVAPGRERAGSCRAAPGGATLLLLLTAAIARCLKAGRGRRTQPAAPGTR